MKNITAQSEPQQTQRIEKARAHAVEQKDVQKRQSDSHLSFLLVPSEKDLRTEIGARPPALQNSARESVCVRYAKIEPLTGHRMYLYGGRKQRFYVTVRPLKKKRNRRKRENVTVGRGLCSHSQGAM